MLCVVILHPLQRHRNRHRAVLRMLPTSRELFVVEPLHEREIAIAIERELFE